MSVIALEILNTKCPLNRILPVVQSSDHNQNGVWQCDFGRITGNSEVENTRELTAWLGTSDSWDAESASVCLPCETEITDAARVEHETGYAAFGIASKTDCAYLCPEDVSNRRLKLSRLMF